MDQLCKLSVEKLETIREKYDKKDLEHFTEWLKDFGQILPQNEYLNMGIDVLDKEYISEDMAREYLDMWKKAINSKWEGIISRLIWIRANAPIMYSNQSEITIELIESMYEKSWKGKKNLGIYLLNISQKK